MLLFTNDSTSVDTVKTYEIPEIVGYIDGLSLTGELTPTICIQSTNGLLSTLPVVPFVLGIGQMSTVVGKARKPSYTNIHLNGRLLQNSFLGFVNLSQLPLHFFDKTSYGSSIAGTYLSSINFESKLNHYTRPYSYARFMFGSYGSNVYGMDLTRAITEDVGFYLSSEYYKTDGYRANAAGQQLSMYSNIYSSYLLPARFDIFYCEDEYGLSGSSVMPAEGRQRDRLLDISSTIAYRSGVMVLFYNSQSIEYFDTLNARIIESQIKELGAGIKNHHSLFGIAIDYGLSGCSRTMESEMVLSSIVYTLSSCVDYPFDVWAGLNKQIGRFSLGATGNVGITGNDEAIYCPKLEIGYDFLKTTYLFAALSRAARPPSDLEKNVVLDTLLPYAIVAGNEDLAIEYCWAKEVGLRGKHYSINLYRFDFSDLITANADSLGYYKYVNLDSWRSSGCEVYLNLPLRFYNVDTSRAFTIMIGGSGNVVLEGDSVPFVPRYNGGGHLSIISETDRFTFGIAFRGELYGARYDITGQAMPGFSVYSLAGLLKFLSLSCVVRLNNLFDEEYAYVPYYPMPLRNFDVSVKWEFWD